MWQKGGDTEELLSKNITRCVWGWTCACVCACVSVGELVRVRVWEASLTYPHGRQGNDVASSADEHLWFVFDVCVGAASAAAAAAAASQKEALHSRAGLETHV